MKLTHWTTLLIVAASSTALFAAPAKDRQIENAAKASYNYRTVLADNKTYNVCKNMRDEDLLNNGTFDMLDRERLQQEKELFEADYVGFAFLAVKKGVFERMEYPWFEIPTRTIGTITDMTSEDCWWCIKAREKGFKIWVDPSVVLGHEKSLVLR